MAGIVHSQQDAGGQKVSGFSVVQRIPEREERSIHISGWRRVGNDRLILLRGLPSETNSPTYATLICPHVTPGPQDQSWECGSDSEPFRMGEGR